ncbi:MULTISPECIES: heavy-metal-associated domain-containing protein [unclassified Janthinobacterium]|uniref:heavy-metal-associated domain-containing protein n=1 Tax=unclassified Janthinobacterium TaxID=2610881 RepID=UPI00034B2763|nr:MULTISPECIES: heavy-metal-associated domain-containing protein [unclassified Janthinobacterium]MEC5163234.1 copper chaperone [Janthinobacterium sp. CG_S6]
MYELQVEEMSCGHCVGAVTAAVRALDPQAQVQVDLAAKTVTVHTDVALARVRGAIEEAGYPVAAAH